MDAPAWGHYRPGALASVLLTLARHTPLGRGAFRKTAYRWFASLHPGPADVDLWGLPVRLWPELNVSERKALLRPDQMDRREHAAVRAAMAKPGAVFVDIGGNAGLYSLSASLAAGPGSRILMIEPDEALIARFMFNLNEARARGRLAPSIDVACCAVAISDREGEGLLSIDGFEGSRGLVGDDANGGGARRVPLETLNSVVARHGLQKINVMKIDVEGHEDKVLPPFLATADPALWPGVIIIEHLQQARWSADGIALALQLGYEVDFRTTNNTVLRRHE